MKKIFGTGTAACDFLGIIPFYPEKDHKVKMEYMEKQCGGPVATALTTLSRLNMNTSYTGILGNDFFGDFILSSLKKEKINTDFIKISHNIRSPFAFCVSEKNTAYRNVFSIKGDNMEPDFNDKLINKMISDMYFFITDGSVPELTLKILNKISDNIDSMIDLGALKPKILDQMNLCTYRIASYQFACEYMKSNTFEKKDFLKKIFSNNAKLTGITLGDKGSMFFDGNNYYYGKAYLTEKIVDTTGCGDVFHGAFVYGILKKWNIEKIIDFSSLIAGIKAQHLGGQKGIPDLLFLKKNHPEFF